MPALQACSLRADQSGAAPKVFRAVFGPRLELAMMGGQAPLVFGAVRISRHLAARDQGQRSVKVVIRPLEDGWRHPDEAFCFGSCGNGSHMVVGKDARL